MKERYGFGPDKAWLDRVQKSAVRLAGGCSASFVSGSGLVMTNHHCAHRCIEELSTAKKNFITDGFYARTRDEELAAHRPSDHAAQTTIPGRRVDRVVPPLDRLDLRQQLHTEVGREGHCHDP